MSETIRTSDPNGDSPNTASGPLVEAGSATTTLDAPSQIPNFRKKVEEGGSITVLCEGGPVVLGKEDLIVRPEEDRG